MAERFEMVEVRFEFELREMTEQSGGAARMYSFQLFISTCAGKY